MKIKDILKEVTSSSIATVNGGFKPIKRAEDCGIYAHKYAEMKKNAK